MSYTFALSTGTSHASAWSKRSGFPFLLLTAYPDRSVHDHSTFVPFFTPVSPTAVFKASPPQIFVHTMSMTDSSSDSSTTTEAATYRDAPTTLLRFPLPECTPSQFNNYLEKTADMFHHLIFDYHQEKKACEEHGTQWQPNDALHETAYQTQLLTMAFLDGHYRTPALVIETINNLQRRAVVQLAIKNLKDLYPLVMKENLEQIFIWLFYKHAPTLRQQRRPLDFIVQRLNIPPDTCDTGNSPEGEVQ